MAVRINELKQKAQDTKTRLRELSASKREASEAYAALLEKGGAEPQAKADAKAKASSFNAEIAEKEELLGTYEAAILDEEKRLALEDKAILASGKTKLEVGTDHATEKPWHAASESNTLGFGRFLQAVHQAHTGNGIDKRLYGAVASGMGETIGADGGFAVPIEYAAGIEKEMWTTGELLSRVDVREVGGNAITYNVINETSRVDGSRRGGVLGYWIDEGTAPDPTKIQLAKMEMKLRKVAALGYMTDELQADATALAGELQSAFTEELIFQTEAKIFAGIGVGSPLGFTNAACFISVAKETNQAATTINVTNLSKMWARIPPRSQANVVWLVNVDTQPQLDMLSIPAGTAALEPRFVNYGPDGILRIKGRPVIPVEYCETLGTLGDIVAVDLSRYRAIRKTSGIETASSMHVRFVQGENTYRAIYRIDGQPVPRSAITPYKGSNTVSPFVGLATRS